MAQKKHCEVFQFPGCQEEWHIIILTLSRLFHSDCTFRKQIQETTWQLLHLYGGFLKWGYSQIIRFNRIFHEINHPAIGVPKFWETPMEDVVPQPSSSWPAPLPRNVKPKASWSSLGGYGYMIPSMVYIIWDIIARDIPWSQKPSPISINHTFINPASTTNCRSNRANRAPRAEVTSGSSAAPSIRSSIASSSTSTFLGQSRPVSS